MDIEVLLSNLEGRHNKRIDKLQEIILKKIERIIKQVEITQQQLTDITTGLDTLNSNQAAQAATITTAVQALADQITATGQPADTSAINAAIAAAATANQALVDGVQKIAATVAPAPPAADNTPATIVISPADPAIAPGSTGQFAAVVNNAAGTAIDPQPVIDWSALVGAIDANGLYTAGPDAGTDTVTATGDGLSASTTVTVG